MKKLLLSSIILLTFSISLLIFDLSCKKSAKADTTPVTTSITQQNKIIYIVYGSTQFNSTIWTANYDGSNAHQINITMPTNYDIADENVKLSPDNKTIFFTAYDLTTSGGGTVIFACNIDGSNPHEVISTNSINIQVAY